MYQLEVSGTPGKVGFDLYENLSSLGITDKNSLGVTNRILLEFVGETTNWKRTVISYAGVAYPRTDRYWNISFAIWETNFLNTVDSEAQRIIGSVFLPQPEMYTINFYYQTSTTNLDTSNATKIDLTSRLNTERVVDDAWNQAPVSKFVEYTDNDLTPGNNENMQYGIN
tara:strand:+ start:4097 stop:4603 length:507 start_codon:yes stop_codon:yes gene_type:complete